MSKERHLKIIELLDDATKYLLPTYHSNTTYTQYTPQLVAIEQLLKSTKACWYIRFLNVMAKNHIEKILPFVIYTMYTYIILVPLCRFKVFLKDVKRLVHF